MSKVMNVIKQNDRVRMLVRNVTIYQISGSNLYFHEVFIKLSLFHFSDPSFGRIFFRMEKFPHGFQALQYHYSSIEFSSVITRSIIL